MYVKIVFKDVWRLGLELDDPEELQCRFQTWAVFSITKRMSD